MKKYCKITKWIALFCLLLLGDTGFAQEVKVHIFLKDGTESEVLATTLSFSDGYVQFSHPAATNAPVEISTIRKLVFEEWITEDVSDYKNEQIILYPNPVQDVIRLSGVENATFSIYSADGKLLQAGDYFSGETIDVSVLPKGFYLIKINKSILKFIKL
ncbi:MAG: T9SS type A sorting domain-containing protein [Bacteroidales bacterium]|jgi:hypothetical protein|nr:T9SS type A sorting domain-containing protein [Bacteroidales bacterium]